MAVDTFKKGSIEMLALFLLCEQDAHGYQLVQLIKEKSEGLVTVQEGSFYPLLYRLEEDGYISGKETLVKMTSGRSRVRVVYHIEPAGRARLEVLRQEYRKVHEGIRKVFEAGNEVV